MKQVLLLAQMTALCIFLCACSVGQADAEMAQEIRMQYLESSQLSLTADVTADYGDSVFLCTLRYTLDGAEGTLEVLAPETIAGLNATVNQGTLTLQYDGAVWDAGTLSAQGLSPAAAIPMALQAWQDGLITQHIPETFRETESIALVTELSDTLYLKTWFDTTTHLPIYGEFYRDGAVVLSLRFTAASVG